VVTDNDSFVKLLDVERKPPDILSDLSETYVRPSVLVSNRTVALSDGNVNRNVTSGERNGEVETGLSVDDRSYCRYWHAS
jgi:hypothetical protein